MSLLPEALIWPLVGREAELDRIAGARTAQSSGVVVSAPAGVGKSRLARHAVQTAEDDGAVTSWVQGTRSAATVPLGAFAGLIPTDVRSDEPLELMRRSVEAMHRRAGDAALVLGVDDAQLLDPTSAALVLQLTTTRVVFVVATVRTGEPCPDAVRSLWKDAGALRLDLRPLSEQDTATLVESVLGGPLEQRAQRWVFESSHGNVLYVRELLLGALEAGALHQTTGGLWRLARRPPPSQSLLELVGARMEGLLGEERRAIELLALGEPLRLPELLALVGDDAVAAVESHGLVTADGPDGDVRLAHPLYGEVVRASMPVIRAAKSRRELARMVLDRPEHSSDDALRVARWLLDAGEPIPGPLLLEAARAANLAGDPELGARFAVLALEGGAGVRATLLLARAHFVRKRYEDAEAVLAPFDGRIDDREVALKYLLQRIVVLYWGLQRADDAVDLLERGRGWWPDPAWRRELDPLGLQLQSLISGLGGAVPRLEEILADPGLEPGLRRRTEGVLAGSLFYAGRTREAHELILRRRPRIPLRNEQNELACAMTMVIGLESGWDFAELDAWMSRALDAGVKSGDHAAAGFAGLTIGALRMLAGRFRESARWLAESVVHFERRDPFDTLAIVHSLAAGVAYTIEDFEGAEAAIERCRNALGGREIRDNERAYIARGEAWAALAQGDPPRARETLLEAAERLANVPVYAALLHHEAVRAGAAAAPQAKKLAAMRERCDAPLVVAYAEHAAARAAGDGAALLRCADEFAAIGAAGYGVECAAAAAEAYAAEGRHDSARRAAARCRELYAGQGGSMPAIRGLDDAAPALTAREAQLVELASRGLSNAEIADRLVLSVRTVESHIYRAMQKLGVGDRRELRSH
ncbi:MAG TPA: LuxR family transcriptional regulator [Solirubrobacteraceae bacterium]|nr:LuxR family transcriptional regulator [Solirubrobacteraceae bacterium]